jgi:hypothetical protein
MSGFLVELVVWVDNSGCSDFPGTARPVCDSDGKTGLCGTTEVFGTDDRKGHRHVLTLCHYVLHEFFTLRNLAAIDPDLY